MAVSSAPLDAVPQAEPVRPAAVPRARHYQGPALLANSFRPFFLLGAIQAAITMLVWLPVFYGELLLTSAFAPRDWHVHEMLYGYLPAAVTGFLFTAIPNWTGRLPVRGTALLMLVGVWLCGRLAVAFSGVLGWQLAMAVDIAFLVLVAGAAAREIVAGRNWRNLVVVGMITLLLAGNAAFHLEAHFRGNAEFGVRIGIAVVVQMIALIGGRIIPSFTRNWLVRENPGRLPVAFARFDLICLIVGAAALASWVIAPDWWPAGLVLAAAGALHLLRLARWAGHRTLRERLLLILHVGYAFVPLGFLVNAAAVFGLVPVSAGIHAWMAGAAGIMTLAVMTRASLGHTGQALTAAPATQAIYAAIVIAAVARVCAVIHPAQSGLLLHVAAAAWVLAFAGFGLAFGPLLAGSPGRALAVGSSRPC